MIVAIDLGGMSAKAACLSDGKLLGKTRVQTSASNSAEETAFALSRLAMRAAESAGVSFEDVTAIGIGAPGVIDSANGVVVSWSNYGWKDIPLAALIEKYSGKKTYVLNDANSAALGEAKYGAGKRFKNCALITIGTGVGAGIVIEGKLFEGYRGAGTEFGHTVIRQDGELCTCGRRGCFECYASATALIRLTKEEMQRNRESLLWKHAISLEDVDGRTAFRAAEDDDAGAKRVLADFISVLGEGIVNLVNLFRPQAVLIGGGMSAEGEKLLQPLRAYVLPRLYVSASYAPFELVCAALGNDAGLYGAAANALGRQRSVKKGAK